MAKSIADKVDFGSHLLDVTDEDLATLQDTLLANGFPTPNVKMSIYKNRRGSYKGVYIWMVADKGTCRFNGIFCTKWNYEVVPMANVFIKEEESAF